MDEVETTSLDGDDVELPQELLWSYEFKRALREDDKILLLHRGVRYQEGDVTEVLYCDTEEDSCPHCGNGDSTAYVSKVKEIIFLVIVDSGCMTYDPEVYVDSFPCMDQLQTHLKKGSGNKGELD